MPEALAIAGSRDVMAPLDGTKYRGTLVIIEVTKVGRDDDCSLLIREGLVGVMVKTIFDWRQIPEEFEPPEGSRFAYFHDVIVALMAAGKTGAARLLSKLDAEMNKPGLPGLYGFYRDEYKLVRGNNP